MLQDKFEVTGSLNKSKFNNFIYVGFKVPNGWQENVEGFFPWDSQKEECGYDLHLNYWWASKLYEKFGKSRIKITIEKLDE